MRRRMFLLSASAFGVTACSGKGGSRSPVTPTSRASLPANTAIAPAPSPAPTTATSPPPPLASPTPTVSSNRTEPRGFPLDPAQKTGLVSGQVGSRSIVWGAGAAVAAYSRDDQPSDDPVRANRCGWNGRLHVEYEGQPAVDWYIPVGTPIVATMDGTATLMVNTASNPFDVYGVSREPYIGNPDRARAPIVPFPGPGGGQGAFVRIVSESFASDYAHMDLARVWSWLPAAAFLQGYTRTTNLNLFGPLRDFRVATAVARWDVKRGDVVGFSGDSGYSEAPHLHYAIRRTGSANLLCPTNEPGFDDAGWLFK